MRTTEQAIDYVKQLPFDKGKFYIVFCDPSYVSFESLEQIEDWPDNGETPVIFIPCHNPNESIRLESFDSIQAIEDFVQQLKETK